MSVFEKAGCQWVSIAAALGADGGPWSSLIRPSRADGVPGTYCEHVVGRRGGYSQQRHPYRFVSHQHRTSRSRAGSPAEHFAEWPTLAFRPQRLSSGVRDIDTRSYPPWYPSNALLYAATMRGRTLLLALLCSVAANATRSLPPTIDTHSGFAGPALSQAQLVLDEAASYPFCGGALHSGSPVSTRTEDAHGATELPMGTHGVAMCNNTDLQVPTTLPTSPLSTRPSTV